MVYGKMQQLISALGDDIKARGRDKWVARCRVHNDKDFAMSIEQRADSSVIAHCHACGANGLDLYKALNLDLDELFGGKENNQVVPNNIVNQLSDDKWFCAIYESDVKNGRQIAWVDQKKYKISKARIKGIQDKYNII